MEVATRAELELCGRGDRDVVRHPHGCADELSQSCGKGVRIAPAAREIRVEPDSPGVAIDGTGRADPDSGQLVNPNRRVGCGVLDGSSDRIDNCRGAALGRCRLPRTTDHLAVPFQHEGINLRAAQIDPGVHSASLPACGGRQVDLSAACLRSLPESECVSEGQVSRRNLWTDRLADSSALPVSAGERGSGSWQARASGGAGSGLRAGGRRRCREHEPARDPNPRTKPPAVHADTGASTKTSPSDASTMPRPSDGVGRVGDRTDAQSPRSQGHDARA